MGIAVFIHTFMVTLVFLISSLVTGYVFKTFKLIGAPYFDILFMLILVCCLLLFYLCFAVLMVIYYRLVLRFIKKRECYVSIRSKEEQWNIQCLRIIVDATNTVLTLPITRTFPGFVKLCGARIGKNLVMKGKLLNSDIIEIGNNVVIGDESIILGHVTEGDGLIFKQVKIGNNVTIGVRALIFPGVRIGDNSIIAAASVVPKDTIIPPNEIWGGVPAKNIKSR